ncbi:MAG: META domain-containing protein [Ilumatobacteraceae bacterium]
MHAVGTGRRLARQVLPSLIMAGLLAVAAAGCGDDRGAAPKDTSVPADPSGTTFVLAATFGIDVPDSSDLQLAFDDAGGLQVSGGCNTMTGPYEIDNAKLVIQSMASTEMACELALMKFDREVGTFLAGSPSITLVGDVMSLAKDDVTMSLRAATQAPDSPLEGTTWTVTGTVQGDGTQSLDTEPATLTLKDGTAQVFAGCNTGTATYTVDGDQITFGPLGLTKKRCDETADLLESVVTKVLTGTVGFDVEGTKLTLFQGAGGLTLADKG